MRKIAYFLIGIFSLVPIFAQNGMCATELYDFSLTISPGTSVIWNITECNDFKIAYEYTENENFYNVVKNVSVNGQFRFTFVTTAFLGDIYEISRGIETDPLPATVGTIEYRESLTDTWHQILGNDISYFYRSYGSYYTFLSHNSSNNEYFTVFVQSSVRIGNGDDDYYIDSHEFFGKYLLFALPPNMNLASYVEATAKRNRNDFQLLYDNYICTSNSMNITNVKGEYNYAEFRDDGITNRWEFKRNSSEISAIYHIQEFNTPSESDSIPFGMEFLIISGGCIAGLLFLVNRNRLSANNALS
ncbi:MAG: hypothetical protein JW891_16630 [Candidatus Lokiarchaeota archaeon]|nr:hypothetical protein [Candidatus Lokiarchaeota archaeon]